MTILNLGRLGDNFNLIPVLYAEHMASRTPTIVTSEKFASTFDAVSYCNVKTYSGNPVELSHAVKLCSNLPDVRIAQVFMNPDSEKREPSFARESYRLGGFRDLWRRFPYKLDRRNPEREQELLNTFVPDDKQEKFIVVAG